MNTTKLNKEIARLQAIKNARIIKALEARADLVVADGSQCRPLVCVSYYRGKEYVTYGAVLPAVANGETNEKGKEIADRTVVRMEDWYTPHIGSRYDSVEDLSKCLDESQIPHVIRFLDEDIDA